MKCKICQSDAMLFGKAKMLQKYAVRFYRCDKCGFIQTEKPHWLKEAYASAITKSDIGLISRNIQMAQISKQLILWCFNPNEKFVDYGGGYGMFVRLMRDQGFDFYRYDPICENLFANHFEAEADGKYALLTAWEVFEHLMDPLAEINTMVAFSRNIIFMTQVLPYPPKPVDQWWYYGLEHGQHISFYSTESLQAIANIFNMKLYQINRSLFYLGDREINPFRIKMALSHRWNWLGKFLANPQPASLLEKDFQMVIEQ